MVPSSLILHLRHGQQNEQQLRWRKSKGCSSNWGGSSSSSGSSSDISSALVGLMYAFMFSPNSRPLMHRTDGAAVASTSDHCIASHNQCSRHSVAMILHPLTHPKKQLQQLLQQLQQQQHHAKPKAQDDQDVSTLQHSIKSREMTVAVSINREPPLSVTRRNPGFLIRVGY